MDALVHPSLGTCPAGFPYHKFPELLQGQSVDLANLNVPLIDFLMSEAPIFIGCSYFFLVDLFLCLLLGVSSQLVPRSERGPSSCAPPLPCFDAAPRGVWSFQMPMGLSLWGGFSGPPESL